MEQHYLKPSFRERALKHIFVGELLRNLWCRGAHEIKVLRAEVDAASYGIVVEATGALRHI